MRDANISSAGIYTEFGGLNALRTQARQDRDGALETVARQFESLFVSNLMKSMREANKVFSEGNYMNSEQTEFYEQMFDSQLSLTLTEKKGIGLADVLVRQLSPAMPKRDYGAVQPGSDLAAKRSIQDYDRRLPALSPRLPQEVQAVDEVLKNTASPTTNDIVEVMPLPSAESAPLPVVTLKTEADRRPMFADVADASDGKDLPTRFDSPQAFVSGLLPIARKVADEAGLDPRLLIAQAALETGWGKRMIESGPGQPSHNLFGIKADSRWGGEAVDITTTEFRDGVPLKERAAFRAYPDYEASFRDYVSFLKQNPRYRDVWAQADDPHQFAIALQEAGYATDPAYGRKIGSILDGSYLRASLDDVAVR